MQFLKYIVSFAVSASLVVGCQKDVSSVPDNTDITRTQTESLTAPVLSYGDTVFYLKNVLGNYIVPPVSKPATAGYFKAAPLGLVIDSLSGNINVTLSETGIRYKVYYLSPAGLPVDSVKIVISGVDYKDAIYEIASTPNTYDTAFPIYNARPELALPCSEDDDDDDQGCVFDETDLNGDGNDDIPGVIQSKFLINEKIGTIDAEASFHAGVFGSSNPANGTTGDFTFYYRLNDASNRALNKITVRLYYYNHRNNIPQTILDTINYRAQVATAVNSRVNIREVVAQGSHQTNNLPGSLGRLEIAELLTGPKRPPIIVIIGQ